MGMLSLQPPVRVGWILCSSDGSCARGMDPGRGPVNRARGMDPGRGPVNRLAFVCKGIEAWLWIPQDVEIVEGLA